MRTGANICYAIIAATLTLGPLGVSRAEEKPAQKPAREKPQQHFQTSDRCIACHNNLTTPAGEDISIGINWRPTMMANSGRDPYWMAGVRRESTDHPAAKAAIEDECSICHMPMARFESKFAGHEGEVFSHLPPNPKRESDRLATDGVSCSVCHQIEDEKLGTRESFVGGFKIDVTRPKGERRVYGPYEVDKGHTRIMNSSSRFVPTEGKHIRNSELCATCHTLLTQALDAQGKVIGELPEQVPYQEWLHSDYKETKSCQNCHMPVVEQEVAITSVMGKTRPEMGRHVFIGGNFFMQRMLNKFRAEMNVVALPQELEAAANRTVAHLQSQTASVAIENVDLRAGRLEATIRVQNLGGHKFPTAYPSRRAWLHVGVKDRDGKVIFESGAINEKGQIQGNDNDADAGRFEPHYNQITSADQVQIYESIMVGADGKVTTGLLTALRYIKDNRLLPKGFNKITADSQIAVHGDAESDADFSGDGDTVRYSVAAGSAQGPFQVEAELWFQPISYRWAENLRQYGNEEARRFNRFYDSMAQASAVRLVRAAVTK